jgi:hypothetical protein
MEASSAERLSSTGGNHEDKLLGKVAAGVSLRALTKAPGHKQRPLLLD